MLAAGNCVDWTDRLLGTQEAARLSTDWIHGSTGPRPTGMSWSCDRQVDGCPLGDGMGPAGELAFRAAGLPAQQGLDKAWTSRTS